MRGTSGRAGHPHGRYGMRTLSITKTVALVVGRLPQRTEACSCWSMTGGGSPEMVSPLALHGGDGAGASCRARYGSSGCSWPR
jgi:hypothetical protein